MSGRRWRSRCGARDSSQPEGTWRRRRTCVGNRLWLRLLGPWASGFEDTRVPASMRKSDCSGSPASSMVLEAKSLRPPQYAQVTSRGGLLLSTGIQALDAPRDGPFYGSAGTERRERACGFRRLHRPTGPSARELFRKVVLLVHHQLLELCHTVFVAEKWPSPSQTV